MGGLLLRLVLLLLACAAEGREAECHPVDETSTAAVCTRCGEAAEVGYDHTGVDTGNRAAHQPVDSHRGVRITTFADSVRHSRHADTCRHAMRCRWTHHLLRRVSVHVESPSEGLQAAEADAVESSRMMRTSYAMSSGDSLIATTMHKEALQVFRQRTCSCEPLRAPLGGARNLLALRAAEKCVRACTETLPARNGPATGPRRIAGPTEMVPMYSV